MLNQFLESHAVQARGRGHDHVSHARHSRGGLHTPADLRGSTEPFVDPDTSVGDRARPIAFKRDLQRFGAGPDLLAGELVGPTRRPGAEVGMSSKVQNGLSLGSKLR